MDQMECKADIIYRFLDVAVPYQPLAGDARPQQPQQQQIKRPQFSSPENPVDGQNHGDEVGRRPGQRQLKRPRSHSPEEPVKRRNIGDEGKGYHLKRQPYGGKGGPPKGGLGEGRGQPSKRQSSGPAAALKEAILDRTAEDRYRGFMFSFLGKTPEQLIRSRITKDLFSAIQPSPDEEKEGPVSKRMKGNGFLFLKSKLTYD